jgi:ribose transport system ATP-binding protein
MNELLCIIQRPFRRVNENAIFVDNRKTLLYDKQQDNGAHRLWCAALDNIYGFEAMELTPYLLEMTGIGKRFSNVVALDQVDFRVRHGEIHALIGENGAGKSTLIKILSGAYQTDSGEFTLDGKRIPQRSPAAMQRQGIAVIYQELNLVQHLNVARNIFLGHEPMLFPGIIDFGTMHRRSQELLAQLGVSLSTHVLVADLGIAEQQLVEVAKALSHHVRLLIMDEPTAPLSEQETALLFSVVRRLRDQGVTVIYISHRLEEIFNLADRVTVLRDGRVVDTRLVQDVTKDDLVRMMVGRDIKEQHPKVIVDPGPPLLRVSNLPGLNGSSAELVVHAGEIVALAGLVGSGRTALARGIFGAESLPRAQIELKGRAMLIRSTRQAIRAGIGMVPEDRKTQGLILDRSVSDNITLPILGRLSLGPLVRRGVIRDLVSQLIRSFDIRVYSMGQTARTLSGGNQQKVTLAKWVASECDVLILDEPTRGVDVGARTEIYNLIGQLVQKGKGILLISSDLPEVLGLSDRIIVVYGGCLVTEFSRRDAVAETIIRYASGTFQE